jgi:hypothetical protein
LGCKFDDLFGCRSLGSNCSAAQVVAIGEASGQDNRVYFFEVFVCMPKRNWSSTSEPNGSLRITIIEGSGVGDDTDTHALLLGD